MASIVYLSPGVFDKGGVSRYCRYQATALREILADDRAVEVLSLLPPDEYAFEQPFRADFASSGPNPRGKILFAAAAASALLARPRVIWAAHLHFAPLGLALARITGAKLALNVYGSEVWTNVTRARSFALRHADHVLSDCHATLRHLVAHDMLDPAKATVHWDCVDTERFCPGDAGDVLDRYGVPRQPGLATILTLARLSQAEGHKGVDRLLDTMALLGDTPARLIVAGGGSWVPVLRDMVRERRLHERVFFTGRVTEADLVNVYRASDVFVLLTLKGPAQGEGLPLTPIEAAACGKPLLVGNQDGSAEAAVHDETGFVIDPVDTKLAAERIRELVASPGTASKLGRAGRARIQQLMSYQAFKARLPPILMTLGLRPKAPHEAHTSSARGGA